MIAVLSPAKSLDFESRPTTEIYTTASMLGDADILVDRMRKLRPAKLKALMGISDNLAELNAQRYAEYEAPLAPSAAAKPAALAFTGHTYVGFAAGAMADVDLEYAQDHVRILSGLYGLLRPLDLIRPYRLEMGSSLKTRRGKNLYEFWGTRLTKELNNVASAAGARFVVNCASNEYFSAVRRDALEVDVVTPIFRDKKGDAYKTISFFAKEARGAMAAHIVRARAREVDDLKAFSFKNYAYSEEMSSGHDLVFARDSPPTDSTNQR